MLVAKENAAASNDGWAKRPVFLNLHGNRTTIHEYIYFDSGVFVTLCFAKHNYFSFPKLHTQKNWDRSQRSPGGSVVRASVT